MNKAILIMPVIAILLGITAFTSTTGVQARSGDGFNDGYAKAKYDFANNLAYNDKCSPNSAYCQHYDSGYKTAWIQEHWSTGASYDQKLLTVNKTA
jgi:hypothetical protein